MSRPRVGNPETDRALYKIWLARMRRDRRTQEYVALGAPLAKPVKSKREIIRCLNHYVAREAYRVLISYDTRASPTGS